MSGRAVGRFTVGRLMAGIAALAVLPAAGMYRSRNADVDRATISANLWALRRGDVEARRRAAIELSSIKPTDSAPFETALAEAIVGDSDARVREAAVHTLGWVVAQDRKGQPPGVVGRPDADFTPTRALLRALSDPRTEVRGAAALSMITVQNVGLVTSELNSAIEAKLFQLLEDPGPTTRANAIAALGWANPPPIAARDRALALMEHDPDVQVRNAAVTALVRGWPSAELYPILLARRIVAPTAPERDWIIKSLLLTIQPPPQSIPALVELMKTDETARRWVPGVLSKLGKGARPYLAAIGRVAEGELQNSPVSDYPAVYALVKIDLTSPEAQAILGPISRRLRDATDESQRAQFTWLLDRYGSSAAPAVPTLREALRSPVPGVRDDAARLLGGIGPPARSAIGDLEPLSRQDPDSTVRASARRAPEKLREPPIGSGSSGTPVEK